MQINTESAESPRSINKFSRRESSICSSILSIFGFVSKENKDTSTTSESSDGNGDNMRKAKSTFKEDVVKSNHKISFMTNYTLIEGLRTLYVKEQLDITGPIGTNENRKFPIRSYSGHSKRGQSSSDPNKKNQDTLVMKEDAVSKSLIFACMDGHGSFGHIVAQFVKDEIEERLCQHPRFIDDLKLAISETIASIEVDLYDDSSIDSSMSGTTLVMAVIRDGQITVANIGDSRVMLIVQEGPMKYESIALSYDHKPDDAEEKARITAAGGRVLSVKYPDGTSGPMRVWRGDADSPGLAMSRSIGDRLVHNWGVASTPSFIEHDINLSEDVALVVASDGLWNVSSDKEVAKCVMTAREPSGAVGLLLRESHNHWVRSGSDSVDDTTVAVAFFNKIR